MNRSTRQPAATPRILSAAIISEGFRAGWNSRPSISTASFTDAKAMSVK